MAKVKFGMFMTDASGKVGGQVFSKNRSGSYVRTKVTPSNKRTPRQTAVRSMLGSISAAWSVLTAPQRASFDEAVGQWARTDIFGDIKNPTGKNLHTRLNINLLNVGFGTIQIAPAKEDMPAVLLQSVALVAGKITFTFGDDAPADGVVISATAPQSAGTSFYKGKFRQIITSNGGMPTEDDLTAAYIAKFGPIAIGMNVAFEFKQVLENGQTSVPQSVQLS